MRIWIALLVFAFVCPVFSQGDAAGNLTNARTAKGQVITSHELPKLKLKFDRKLRYAGGHTFILYDVARAEQHFYVEADKDGNVSRMYWVQFEGYLPTNSHSYNYRSPKTVKIGGLDFFADVSARKIDPKQGRPDSDGNRARAFLLSKGFRIAGDEVMTQRLVHLLDNEKRNELMIIYLEVLTPTGFTSAELAPNGTAHDKWPSISDGLLQRAIAGLEIVR